MGNFNQYTGGHTFSFDESSDTFTIDGINYSGDFFKQFGLDMPVGRWFRITRRDGGTVRIEAKDKSISITKPPEI